MYINRDVDVFSVSDSRMTGLMHACINGHVEIVELLLQTEGVTKEWVDHADDSGKTALTHAVMKNHIDCITALIAFGANVNTVDSAGMSVLQQSDDYEVLEMLLEAGAVDTPARDGRTLLMDVCEQGDVRRAELLLQYKSDVNVRCKDGYTPLMRAMTECFEDIVVTLLDNGADPLLAGAEGTTVLMKALDREWVDDSCVRQCLKLIIDHILRGIKDDGSESGCGDDNSDIDGGDGQPAAKRRRI
jgi:ankyrin repeat protein